MDRDKPLVLVIDDEKIYLDLLCDLLQDECQLRLAENGIEGLQKSLVEPLPDLILLDWLLPDIQGTDVCTQLKANPITADIPVLFLTIKTNIDDEIRGFEAGAVDYIHKPISPPQLLARLRTHIKLKQVNSELIGQKQQLERLLEKRNEELEKTRELAISFIEGLGTKRNAYYLQSLSPIDRPQLSRLLKPGARKDQQRKTIPARDDVLQQLEKILSSKAFNNAQRMQSLLQFIVTETLDGHSNTLKAFTIAVEVFERDSNFDPQLDPLIRVQAGNLRKRLDQYYLTEGKRDKTKISVPKGSYFAKFSTRPSVAY